MNEFEKQFEDHFMTIRKQIGAFLFRLYPPMRVGGMRGHQPMFVQVGRALYDVGGWQPISVNVLEVEPITPPGKFLARTIGIELKSTKQRHPSMRIVKDDADGSGLQEHQLEALAALARDGGIAKVLWSNGGVVGVLDEEEIRKAFHDFGVSLAAEKMGKEPARGSRSIPWQLFRVIDLDEDPSSVISFKRAPTLAQELSAKRRKAAKQIDKAAKEREREDAGSFFKEDTDED